MQCGTTANLIQALIIFLVSVAISVSADAEFYKYTDRDGTIHFVDDPGKIPRQYAKKTKSYAGGQAAGNVTYVRIVGNQVLVPVTLGYNGNRVQATLLLDTGATVTAVDSDIVAGLNVENSKTRSISGRVAGGGIVSGRLARIDFIEVGPHRISDFDIAAIPHDGPRENHDGLLGMNFLRNFHYKIDFENQKIHWR